MPKWTPPSNIKTNLLPIVSVLGLFTILWILFLPSFLETSGFGLRMLNFFFLTSFVIYLIGRVYGELGAKNDFIDLSSEGIKYRETPSFQMGWLPSRKFIKFEEIRSVDMVSVKKPWNPNEESFGILIHLNKGKSRMVGSKLEQKQLLEIAFALKGSVMLTGSLKRILGEDASLHDMVDTAKNVWNTFKQRTQENINRRYSNEKDD